MSSVLRGYGPSPSAQTKFVPIQSLTYQNNVTDHRVLVPFTYANGVLDVASIPGFDPADGEGNNDGFSWRMVKAMGGEGLVHTLGANFLTWFYNFYGYDNGTTPEIYVAPVMTKVQQSVPSGGSILNSQYATSAHTTIYEPPTSNEFVTGTNETAGVPYDTAYIFKTPLVLKIQNGGTEYVSLYSFFGRPY